MAELLDTDPHSSDRGGGRARRRRTRGSPILGALGKYYEDNVKTIVFGYLLILSPHPGAGRGRAGAGRARPGPRPRPAPRPRLPEAARPALCGHVDILAIMAMLASGYYGHAGFAGHTDWLHFGDCVVETLSFVTLIN